MRKSDAFSFRLLKIRICLLAALLLLASCGDERQTKAIFAEATSLFYQEDYAAAMDRYSKIIESSSSMSDRALFEMGITLAHPKNGQRDYQKSLECFQRLIRDYPDSDYRQNSERMIFNIRNSSLKDQMIAAQRTQLETMRVEILSRDDAIVSLQKQVETLKQTIIASEQEKLEQEKLEQEKLAGQETPPADKVVIEKALRQMTLMSNGEAFKSYKIALGGNPVGRKERKGDNKTPEGIYFIEGRNRSSQYHLSLRISYPNEYDRKRARELGVSTGGDIMIHGLKNGFSQTGESHVLSDWTEGCIAVTNEEIDEIDKLVPDGTIVEILP